MMKPLLKTLTTLALGALALSAQAEQLKVMTSGGFTAAYKLLGPQYAKQSGDSLDTILGPSMGKAPEAIPNRLARGEHAYVVIMVGYALDDLIKQGKVDPASRVELADSRIGLVVKAGAVKPAIGTDAELKAALSKAKSVAYSDSASGVYVEKELFKKLGMPAKGTMIERLPVAEQVAKGDYEVGLQQVAELLPVPGVTYVGKIPEDVQSVTRFAAGIPINAEHPEQAKALLQYLASPQAQPVVQATGLDSVSRRPKRHFPHQSLQLQRRWRQGPPAAFYQAHIAHHLRFHQRHAHQDRVLARRHGNRGHHRHSQSRLHQPDHRRYVVRLADTRLFHPHATQRLVEQEAVTRGLVHGDVVVFVGLGPAHAVTLGQGMIAATGQHITLLQQQFELHFIGQTATETHAEIRLATFHRIAHFTGTGIQHPQANFRIQLVEFRDHVGHEVVRGGRHARDGDIAHAGGRHIADAHERDIEIVEHALDLRQERTADHGQADAPRGAFEQLYIQGGLELFDTPAEGRLRDPDSFGGTAKTALVYHGAEGLEVVEVEVDDHGKANVVEVAGIIVWEPMARHACRDRLVVITLLQI